MIELPTTLPPYYLLSNSYYRIHTIELRSMTYISINSSFTKYFVPLLSNRRIKGYLPITSYFVLPSIQSSKVLPTGNLPTSLTPLYKEYSLAIPFHNYHTDLKIQLLIAFTPTYHLAWLRRSHHSILSECLNFTIQSLPLKPMLHTSEPSSNCYPISINGFPLSCISSVPGHSR